MSAAAASLERVWKRFGGVPALCDVSLEAPAGSVVALLGPNGAGKSTALSLLLGLRRPERGRARLFGSDPRETAARRRLGATPQEMAFPQTLRVVEIVDLVRAHYERPLATGVVLSRFGLERLARRQAGGLSGGERRRLAVAIAFAGDPEIVVLDEPTTGLDVDARRTAWSAIQAFAAAGGTVLLTTHHLDEAEALASAVVVLDRGRAIARGTIEEIRARAGQARVRFRAEPLPDDLEGRIERNGETVTIYARHPTDLVRRLVYAGARMDDLEVTPLPLEDALRGLGREREG
jgi:ABC-2 type transport system ATP-binding protein